MSTKDDAPKDGSNPEENKTPTENKEVETLESLTPKEEEAKESDKVPLNKYMDEKRARKDAEIQAEALRAEVEKLKVAGMQGMALPQINDQLKELAKEYNVDETFIAKLVSTVRTATKSEIKEELEKDYTPKLARIEQERKLEQSEKKFEQLFSKTLKEMPEYEGIINKDVIKALAFSPSNAKKTLPQILEETYGTAIQGKKTIETTHASREAEVPDYVNPTKEDWEKIESDPTAKKKWVDETSEQLKRYM